MHIDPKFGEADLDVVLPMRRLTELSDAGVVGRPARRHYSIMGYILEPTVLVEKTAPAIAEQMRIDDVDAVALSYRRGGFVRMVFIRGMWIGSLVACNH